MKCPKCEYLSFDTGDRCRNCGYEFSLLSDPPIASATATPAPDLDLRLRDDDARPHPPPSFRGEPALPLFGPGAPNDDEPLIKVPAAPRPPLAVRRTPDTPRLRTVTKHQRVIEPTLSFQDPPEASALSAGAVSAPRAGTPPATSGAATSGIPRRGSAGLIDLVILLAIDATIIDFTLRLASLTWADWRLVPPVPMLAFLGLIKLAYFSVFTAVGGQTIGKMAAGIRVVADNGPLLEPSRAVQRSVLGVLSLAAFGAGFIPLFFGSEHRALHDRVAHTRVVTVPAA